MPFASRILIIFNPASGGSGSGRLERVVAALEAAGAEVTLRATAKRGDAEAMAREACMGGGYDIIVAAGGDGTIGEVINGFGTTPPPLAVLPLGTANVFAAEIGLSWRVGPMVCAILKGRPTKVFTGRANGRRFLIMAGAGVDAEVVANLDANLKRRLGKLSYVVETWRQMFRYDYPLLDVSIDGKPYRAVTAVACKGRKYGGPHIFAPGADVTRADFVVTLFDRGGAWRVALYGVALVLGLLPRLPGIRHIRARTVEVAGRPGAPVQGDGDVVAELPVAVAIDPVPLTVLYPPA